MTVLVVGFFAATEWLIRTRVEPHEVFSAHAAVFHEARDSGVRNAAFGDSVPARGFDATTADFVNLGLGGESPTRTMIKLRAFYHHRKAGRVILIAGPHTLLINDPEDYGGVYESAFENGARPWLRVLDVRNRYFALRFWRIFILHGGFEERSRIGKFGGLEDTDPADEIAYQRMPKAKRMRQARTLLESYESKPKYFEHIEKVYRQMIGFLKAHDANVCLAGFPWSESFQDAALGSEFVLRTTPGFWQRVAADTGVRYVDFFDHFDTDTLFHDPQHLNRHGSRMFRDTLLQSCFGRVE